MSVKCRSAHFRSKDMNHHRLSTSDDDSGCALEEYAWVPSGLHPMMVQQYFSHLPEEKVPYLKSAGEKWRVRQLLVQLPPQDSQPRYCRSLGAQDEHVLRAFDQRRRRDALGQGVVQVLHRRLLTETKCRQCEQVLNIGDLVISTDRLGDRHFWHPYCFVCHACSELLIDLIYFHKEGRIYCGRHHAELLKPRCGGCDELIFADECIEAEGVSWHLQHFVCDECGSGLGGCRYVMKDGKPRCLHCLHLSAVAQTCSTCCRAIANTDARMTYGRLQWHASKQCFLCYACGACLLGASFSCHGNRGQLFCGEQCQRAFDRCEAAPSPPAEDGGHSAFYKDARFCRSSRAKGAGELLFNDDEDQDVFDERLDVTPNQEALYETIASNLNSAGEGSDVGDERRDSNFDKPTSPRQETTFAVEEEQSPSSSNGGNRFVHFDCRPTLHHISNAAKRSSYCSTCSSSSSSSSGDEEGDDGVDYLAGANNNPFRLPVLEKGCVAKIGGHLRGQQTSLTTRRRRRRQNCIVS